MISVLIPERERPAMLQAALRSLLIRSDDGYEILVAGDDDDPTWHPEHLPVDQKINYFTFRRPATLGIKLNLMANQAQGEILTLFANDMLMGTAQWAQRIHAAVDRMPHGIGVPYLKSSLSPGVPTYPVITRRMMEKVGFFMDPAYPFWFLDDVWADIGIMTDTLHEIDVSVSPQQKGPGKTHGLVDLAFWATHFLNTRWKRVQIAERILGHTVPWERVSVCIARTAHMESLDWIDSWSGMADSPPGDRYGEAKRMAIMELPQIPRNVISQTTFLGLLQSVLTGTLFSDPAADPWSTPTFDLKRRESGLDWPKTALTMIGVKRMHQLREACETVLSEGVEGDFIETGVWRGGALIYMRAILAARGVSDRLVFGADSFQGLPHPAIGGYAADVGDQHHQYHQLAVPMDEVVENFRRFGLWDRQVRLLPGWFKDTLPGPVEKLAVLRIDCDMYSSTWEVLTTLYPLLSSGGFCIVDDYNLRGCRQAVHDYRKAYSITDEIQMIDGQGVFWRKS